MSLSVTAITEAFPYRKPASARESIFSHFHRFSSGDQEGSSLRVIVCLLNTSSGAVIEKFPLWVVAMLCLTLPYIFPLVLILWRMVLKLIQHDNRNLSFLQNSEAQCLHALGAHQSVTSKICRQTSWIVLWLSEQKYLLFWLFSFLLNVNHVSSAKKKKVFCSSLFLYAEPVQNFSTILCIVLLPGPLGTVFILHNFEWLSQQCCKWTWFVQLNAAHRCSALHDT